MRRKSTEPGKGLALNTLPRWLLAAAVLGMPATLSGGGWFYYTQRQYLRQDAEEDLQAVALLKVEEIVQWRAERLGDASVLMEDPFFGEAVARWMARPQAANADSLRSHFRSLQTHYHYHDVVLVDAGGKARLSLSGELGPLAVEAAEALAASFRDRRAVFSLLHSTGDYPAPHLGVVAPFFTRNGPTSAPLGAVILWTDGRQLLYPLIQSWPRPSASAETLLVRREGDSVLYLNELRHQHNTALKLRVPLSQTNAPAVMAVLGREGIFQGKDYRGVEVLSALKAVPDSPWFIEAKMDAAEAFAPWRFQSTIILGLIFALMLVAATGFGILWQKKDKAHYRALYLGDAALRASEEQSRAMFDVASIGMAQADPRTGQWLRVNPKMCGITGYSASELLQMRVPELTHAEDRQRDWEAFQRVVRGEAPDYRLEKRYVRKDGALAWVNVNMTVLRDPAGQPMRTMATIEDITERKRVEEELSASEVRYRRLFETAKDGVLILEAETGMVVDVNPFLVQLLGVSHEAFLGKQIWELGFFKDIVASRDNFEKLRREGYIRYDNRPLAAADGRRIDVEFVSNLYRVDHHEVIQCNIRDIAERKRAEKREQIYREQLRALSARLENLREEERTRIAREIHDELGQMLTCIKMDLRWMERHLDEFGDDRRVNPILDQLVATTELADATITTVQRIAADLRPGILDKLGLPMTLQYEGARFEERTGIPCRLVMPSDTIPLGSEVATAFFRIFQEGLTNVARHAKARAVEVELQLEADGCRLEIRDDGKGMTGVEPALPTSLGLLGMQERARLLGGEVTFGPRPGGGTVVTVRIPSIPASKGTV
jgi:PAS domain S-box-containing protein